MDISELICEIKKDKEKFILLLQRFQPLIRKYVKTLYKEEADDMYAEFAAALWEAVCSIQFYRDDGQTVKYLTNALRNKYFELYRKSRKYNDHIIEISEREPEETGSIDSSFDDVLINEELQMFRDRLKGKKRQIFNLIFLKGYTDLQAAHELNISRQYVHRVRRSFVETIKEKVLDLREN